MTEFIKVFASLFQSVTMVESAVFLIYMLIAGGVFFVLKIWFPQYLRNKELENEREERKAESAEAQWKNISTLLQSNTSAIESFNRSISILGSTLEKVSDKIHEQDARMKMLNENVRDANTEVGRLKENIPNMTDMNRLHQRIDELKSHISDKNDITLIINKLDQILESILEIKGRLS